ncbi:MAG: ATP-binding protein [Anaerolineae bacterium]
MELIQLTQISITVLAQLVLLVACTVYLFQQKSFLSPGWIMICFCLSSILLCLTQFISVSLPHLSPIHAFIVPLQYVPGSMAITALIQLNYRFPIDSNRFKFESYIILGITVFITLLISASAVIQPFQISDTEIQLMSAAVFLEFAWAIFVTLRNYFIHLSQSDQIFPQSLLNPASQITRAFNYFLLILTIPFLLFVIGLSITFRLVPPTIADISLAIGGLLFIYFLIGLYLNRSWQRTSFLAQLLASIIVTQLILISIAALIFAPRFSANYKNDSLLAEEQTLTFTPQTVGYQVDKGNLEFDFDLGEKIEMRDEISEKIELPFPFPYFEDSYNELYLSDNRLITFNQPFDLRAMRDGLQAGIAVMAMDIALDAPFNRPDSGVYVKKTAETMTITWYQLPLKERQKLSTAQLVLDANGQVKMAFVSHDLGGWHTLYPLNAPWLIGLQTKSFNQSPHLVNFEGNESFSTNDTNGIIEDYYIPYRSHIHQSMQPMIILLGVALALTLGGFPLFIGYNILTPIRALVGGIREVNQGNLNVALRVRRNDEIGYLTDSFNQMVGSIREKNKQLNENSLTLETRVRQRTSMLAEMTEQAEKARKEAIEANQTKSAFIANVTHEIRTPLNAIIGFSDILREDVHDAGRFEWEGDLVRIRDAANDLLAMINDILDISKIEAGRTSFFYDEFNLKNMAVEIIDFLQFILQENNNKAKYIINSEETMLHGDYMKIRQILQNLLSNAAKFTQDGIIHLIIDRITEKNQFFYLIQVRDTGIGITPEQMDRIFEPFQQADNSITRDYGGSGLGLAISRQYAEMMGGRLWVESKPGIGSTFFLALPLKPPSSAEIARRIKENGTLML